MKCWWFSVHSCSWTCGFRGPLGAQGAVGCPLATTHVNHFLLGYFLGVDLSGVDFVRRGCLGVDLLGVDFGMVFLFPRRNRQTAADLSNNPCVLFTPKSTPRNSPQNPPPAAQWPCHCCSCHFSLTCENDRVPSSMITAIRGRQRECVLLDGSQVQQTSDHILGKRKFTRNPLCKETGPI